MNFSYDTTPNLLTIDALCGISISISTQYRYRRARGVSGIVATDGTVLTLSPNSMSEMKSRTMYLILVVLMGSGGATRTRTVSAPTMRLLCSPRTGRVPDWINFTVGSTPTSE